MSFPDCLKCYNSYTVAECAPEAQLKSFFVLSAVIDVEGEEFMLSFFLHSEFICSTLGILTANTRQCCDSIDKYLCYFHKLTTLRNGIHFSVSD